MTEPQITSHLEHEPKHYYTMHFPEVKGHEMSANELIDKYARSHHEELKNTIQKYSISKQTLEAFCKCEVFYLHNNKFDETLLKNISEQKLSHQNLEKYGTILEITENATLTEEEKRNLRNLTDLQLNNLDETSINDTLLLNQEEQEAWLRSLLERTVS